MRRHRALALLAGLMFCPAVLAAGSGPAPSTRPADDRLKTGFEALPEAERRAVQDALLWTGEYVGVVNGTFGPRTRDALASFAKKNAGAPDTMLDAKTRARLMAAAAAARAGVGFGPVKDKTAGVSLSLPMKLLVRKTATDGGTRYASADGAFVVDTLSRPAGPGGLAEVFGRMSTASGQRKVTYKLLKPDFFVVSGEIGERKFYSRFVLGSLDDKTLIRGLTLAYPKADGAALDPVVLASAGSFDAFPSGTPATAAATPPGTPPPPPPAPATFAVTAIRIAPGIALTHLPTDQCFAPSLAGAPLTLRKADKASGLAVFEMPSTAGAFPGLTLETVAPDASLMVLFSAELDGLALAPAEIRFLADGGANVSVGIQGRAEGTPLIDRDGRLAGLLSEPLHVAPSLAGTRLQNDYPFVGAVRLKAFLDAAGIPLDTPPEPATQSLGAIAALWRPMVLRIVCQTAPAP